MKYLLQIIAFVFFLQSCKTANDNEHELLIRGLRHHANTNSDEKIFEIRSSDIVCVDWKNQSYKISEKAIEQIVSKGKFTGGFINEFLQIEFDGEIIETVNIHNPGSSAHYFVKNSPSAFIFSSTNTIFNSKGWLIINPISQKENSVYNKLYSDSVFQFLKKGRLLTGDSWACKSDSLNDSVANSPNLEFEKDIDKCFGDELIK